MTNNRRAPGLAAGLLALAWSASLAPVRADIRDYEFQLVELVTNTGEAIVSVRLVNKKSNQPVSDAVIFARRIDMAPDGMAGMTAPLAPLPTSEPGVYRFRTSLAMAGGWRLSLAAKVQGETGTVEARLVLRAAP